MLIFTSDFLLGEGFWGLGCGWLGGDFGGICMSRPRGRSVMLSEIPGPSVLRMLVPLWGSTWQNKSVVPDYRSRPDGISGILLILISFLTYCEYLMGWGKPAQYVTGAASISLMCVCYVYIMSPHIVWTLWYFMVPYISSGCDLPEWDIGRSMVTVASVSV